MTTDTGSDALFLGHEYDTLKAELLEAVRETRVLERYALAVTAAIWSWLLANPRTDDRAWWTPVVIVGFFYIRVIALEVHGDAIARYLRRVEKGLAPGVIGFEAWFAGSGDRQIKRVSSWAFWLGLLVATGVGPFILKPTTTTQWMFGVGLFLVAAAAIGVLGVYAWWVVKHKDEMMDPDEQGLRSLNIEIGKAEARGDAAYFEDLLAPVFAMRRADGTSTTDRDGFISAVAKSAERETRIESVTLLPADRAFVTCTVAMQTGEGRKRFHNARLFTREASDRPWRLLAWANEPMR